MVLHSGQICGDTLELALVADHEITRTLELEVVAKLRRNMNPPSNETPIATCLRSRGQRIVGRAGILGGAPLSLAEAVEDGSTEERLRIDVDILVLSQRHTIFWTRAAT